MISEACVQEFQGEMSNAENVYEYVYSCFTIFIGIVQLYLLIEYCLFRLHYANQYEINDHIKEKICRRIAGRIPRDEMERKMSKMAERIELLESSLNNPEA